MCVPSAVRWVHCVDGTRCYKSTGGMRARDVDWGRDGELGDVRRKDMRVGGEGRYID